jgi:hypothetical protein
MELIIEGKVQFKNIETSFNTTQAFYETFGNPSCVLQTATHQQFANIAYEKRYLSICVGNLQLSSPLDHEHL